MPFNSTKNTLISKDDCISQFRILKNMKTPKIVEVETLEGDRSDVG